MSIKFVSKIKADVMQAWAYKFPTIGAESVSTCTRSHPKWPKGQETANDLLTVVFHLVLEEFCPLVIILSYCFSGSFPENVSRNLSVYLRDFFLLKIGFN